MGIRTSFNPMKGAAFDPTPVRFDPIPIETGENTLQLYTVPAGVKKLLIECVATGGVGGTAGGKVECFLDVKPKQKLYIWAGKVPSIREKAEYNASDVRTVPGEPTEENSLKSRLIVAGGAGSTAIAGFSTVGGDGGGLQGKQGGSNWIAGGVGGNQTEGGNPGYYISGTGSVWAAGTKGQLGLGGDAPNNCGCGGSGYYGGGSGSYGQIKSVGACTTGGGGGSSYTDAELCSEVIHTQGANAGDGYVIITPVKK